MRRYCAANGLDRLGTLTYAGAGCHDPHDLRTDVGAFFRDLRASAGGRPLPYVWVPEWHPGGHGLHVHFAVGQFIRKSLIERSWGRGFVHIKRLSDMPVGASARDHARRAAGYLSKYVSKTFDTSSAGLHRYEVAQGFQPRAVRLEGRTCADVVEQACHVMGSAPVTRWSSTDAEDWSGPPAVWFQWA
ncbi:MAG: rolling circle replication-associated protein [Candidatus Nanopelagicales bacterium]